MSSRRAFTLVAGIIVLSFVATFVAYPRLPDRVASHWNVAGRVDGWMEKGVGVFLVPLLMVGLAALLWILPLIDPLKRNIVSFRTYYDTFAILVMAFFLVLQLHLLLWNLGTAVSPNRLLPIPFGIMIYYAGVLTRHARPNWFIGVRTPWTLSSEAVWDKTHRVTGVLFRACGVLSVVGFAFEDRWLWFLIVPLVGTAVFAVAYSYLLYRKEATGEPPTRRAT